jgi:signal transduction histidine kinase
LFRDAHQFELRRIQRDLDECRSRLEKMQRAEMLLAGENRLFEMIAKGHSLAPILEETRVLGRLIDDLRTLALSEAGTLALHPEPTDPDILIGEVVRSFEPSAAAAGVTLTADVDGDLPILDIDPVRIREVLTNLVANALRHTPAGGRVTIWGTLERGGRWVRLEVRDTGAGIEPALLPHVFDRFVKGDASRGSGLGLAIARQLTEAHGGEITAESAVGTGTTIRVRLPVTGD